MADRHAGPTPFERVAVRLVQGGTPITWADPEGAPGVFMRALPDGRIRVVIDPEAVAAAGLQLDALVMDVSAGLSNEDFAAAVDRLGAVWTVTGTPRPPIPEGLSPRQADAYRAIRKSGQVRSGSVYRLETLRQLEGKGLVRVSRSSEWNALHPEGAHIAVLAEDADE